MLGKLRNRPSAIYARRRRAGLRVRGVRARSAAGFTIIEIIIALVLVSIVYAIALPSIGRTRVSASVHNARHVVVSSISLARATAMRFGGSAVLRLDAANDRLWVEADTTLSKSGEELVRLGYFDFGNELHVNLDSNRTALCFNGRGIGTTGTACPQAGATIVVFRGDRADTVRVSPTGRVLP